MVTNNNELLGQALGTCTIRRLIGRGGMGAVYLAQQSRPRRAVAVKVLMPGHFLNQQPRAEFLVRFRREADAVAALDHVNIMPVYEYGEQADYAYLVMPYVTGGTLRQLIEKRGRLTLAESIPIIEQAAAALDSAHAQGIIHRDLKPGNILFHADGRVLLADFGLAKMVKDVQESDSHGATALTSAGAIIGTPEYLSPEQGMGKPLDHRTDIYSLGIVLYHMLAGHVPFHGSTPVAVAIKHALEEPPSLIATNPDIPVSVEAVIRKAIAKSPDDRYSSAGEFAHALRAAASGLAPEPDTQKPAHSPNETAAAQSAPPLLNGDEEKTVSAPQEEVRLQSAREGIRSPEFNTAPTEEMLPTQQAPSPRAKAGPQQPGAPGLIRPVAEAAPRDQAAPPVYRPISPTSPLSRRMMLLGTLLVLVVIVGGLASYLYFAQGSSNKQQNGIHATTTPTPGSTQRTSGPPQAVAPATGTPIFYTTYPGPGPHCDTSGAQWTTVQGTNPQCGNDGLTLNPSGQRAGVILTSFGKGKSLSSSYVVQVQATVNSGSGMFGIFFLTQPGQDPDTHAWMVDPGANTVQLFHYNQATGQSAFSLPPQRIYQGPVGKTMTLDVQVNGNSAIINVNGNQIGSATDLSQSSGTTGLAADPGTNVTFKNLAIYAA